MCTDDLICQVTVRSLGGKERSKAFQLDDAENENEGDSDDEAVDISEGNSNLPPIGGRVCRWRSTLARDAERGSAWPKGKAVELHERVGRYQRKVLAKIRAI